jgi:hypothetical protein
VSRQVENSGRKSQASGLSDTDLFLGYEFLPEWTYSTWRPRGFAYFQQVLPTGRAIQDPEKKNAADVRGLGVSQSALGAVFLKSWAEWDLSITPELRRFYSADLGATQIGSGWGASMLLNGGYSWLDLGLRVGLRTQPVLQSSRALKSQEVSGGFESEISSKSVWNSGVDFSWMPNDQWRANVGYSDQTWFGPARNTTLERSVAISGQYRWAL